MMETARSTWVKVNMASRGSSSTKVRMNQVSGGIWMRECPAKMRRSSVVPDRPEPMMKNGVLSVTGCYVPAGWRWLKACRTVSMRGDDGGWTNRRFDDD
jgi:hypothetical protein